MTGRARKTRLTDAGVGRLRPGKTEYVVWDSQVAGLGVRVRPSGHRSFVWHGLANGAAVRVTVGSAALTTVEEARRECPMLQNGMELSGRNDWKDRFSVPLFQDFVMNEWWPAYQRRCARSSCRSVDQVLRRRLLTFLRPPPAEPHRAARGRTLVRRLQPDSARRSQQGAPIARPDHEFGNRRRPYRHQPYPGHQEESS